MSLPTYGESCRPSQKVLSLILFDMTVAERSGLYGDTESSGSQRLHCFELLARAVPPHPKPVIEQQDALTVDGAFLEDSRVCAAEWYACRLPVPVAHGAERWQYAKV